MSRDALVVGISTYQYPKLNKLEAPAKDAEDIAQCLESSLLPFQVKRLPEIVDKENNRLKVGKKTEVSLTQLKQELFKLFKPKGSVITDTGLFYFSGHGLYDQLTEEGYLATSDANPDQGNWGFPLHTLRKLLQDSPVRQQIIWLDCCHSGSLIVLNEANPGKDPDHSRCFIAASRDIEVAYQLVSGSHGVLTDALLEGLDPNRVSGEWIDTLSLSAFVSQYLQKVHPTYPQKPLFINDGQVINLIRTQEKQESESKSDPPPPKTTVGLENIAEIPVWVGRDALIQELKAKLLAPETAPKVLAIIGQGGIGKTSLGVKLLESLGVQLQPPNLTETCVYEKVLYFKVYPGTSFDDVAEFLLRGLDMETVEPLKTPEEKIRNVLEGLTKQRGVVVLDNLEDILHPGSATNPGKALSGEWGQLLNRFVYGNHCSTIMLTSREFPVDLADSRCDGTELDPDLVFLYSLEGIGINDGVELLRRRQIKDKEEDLRWISQRVQGHVFVLTQLAAFARTKPGYLRKHPELVTKKAEPILRVQLARQNEPGRDLLRRMCVLRVPTDLRGLTFLRLYEDEWETNQRLIIAAQSTQPISFTDEEINETESIVKPLVDSSLVQMRYDEQKCELFYDLHQIIADFMEREYDRLPQLFKRVSRFFRAGNFQLPDSLQALSPLQEAWLFAFHLGDENKASELGITILNYSIRLGQKDVIENAVLQAASITENYDQADGLIALAQVHYDLSNWNQAEKYLQEALKIAQANNKPESIAAALGQLGSIQRNRGKWDEAEKLYRQCLEVETELGDRAGMASSWGCLGDIARNRGKWDEAEKLYRQCLEVETELGDRAGMATSWGCLGSIARNRGNWDEAEKLYRQSLDLSTELGDRAGMASNWGRLGYIARNRGKWDEAEKLYRQCLEIETELGDRPGMASSWGVLGDIARNRGKWDEAEKLYRQSLDLRTELGDRAGMAETWASLGENELGKGNLDTAEQYLTEALADMENLKMTWHIAETNFDLAKLWRQRGNEEIAQKHYEKSHQLYEKLGAMKDLERIERDWRETGFLI
ncbi:tetratricopeptide repeat protein [Planktothricoides raciborskii]|uniref:Tetratricopeptide repeat protein n=1 Tax=Planktothricoides raciborskii FACHB-1370 TaxID=2949576 RepID=A0ABR8EIW1_9CYAN|nr:tetratricopeptide repeat protein [Planktothricoides raciborskii]MBD2546252.1 tetratricopeptide repeat protein [Planktothricoides raciborskii FACHB-1370]MBD2584527.1 tetratricopeptide repeat protein [Planktothricoides raciborskii FACHB-1261]